MSAVVVSEMDKTHLAIIRKNVADFLGECSRLYGGKGKYLDVAPQDHEGARPYFPDADIETLDIDPSANATYTADLCARNESSIPGDRFDWIGCTEVLEHVLDPFAAVRELHRILKPGGYLFVTTPFNFRIHGPLPDCWRFTEHGLRALLREFKIISLGQVATPGRDLMPVQYTVVAQK